MNVVDTKLAHETRAGTILQLVCAIQQTLPEHRHVVTPGTGFKPESYRVREYLAYYRLVRNRLRG